MRILEQLGNGTKTLLNYFGRAQEILSRWLNLNLERIKYAGRKRKRKNVKFPIIWRSAWVLIRDDFAILLNTEKNEEKIKENITRIDSSRKEVQNKISKRSAIMTAGSIYLLLGAFSIDIPLTIGGFTITRVPGLNELLLLSISVLNSFSMPLVLSNLILGYAMRGYIKTKETSTERYIFSQVFLPEESPSLYQPEFQGRVVWTSFMSAISNMNIMYLLLQFLTILLIFFFSRFAIYKYILENPSLNVSIYIVTASAIFDALSVVYSLAYFCPVPYRDYSMLEYLSNLEVVAPSVHRQESAKFWKDDNDDEKEMIRQGVIKGESPPQEINYFVPFPLSMRILLTTTSISTIYYINH